MSTPDAVRPVKRRGLLFKLGVVFGALIVFVVIAYFVVTSSAFFTGFILPKVSKAANAQVTVTGASISPWSEIVLTGLKVVPNGREQLVQAEQVRARYSLADIIRGKIVVREVTLTSPVITLVQNADGTSNTDPLTKKEKAAAPEEPKKPAKAGAPPQLDIKNVALKNARIEVVKNLKGGGKQVTQVSGFDLAIDQIQNGQPGKLTYSGALAYEQTGNGKTNQLDAGSVEAKFEGAFSFLTTASLDPQSISGTSRVDIGKATGAMSSYSAFAVAVDCDLTPAEIRKVNVRFEQSGKDLGDLRVAGPFSMANREGRLKLELAGIDKQLLNVVGAQMGYDFNKTTVTSSNDIELKQKGAVISINGQLAIANLSLTQKAKNQTTPTLDLQTVYKVDVDQNNKSALIQKFDFNATQNQKTIIHSALSKPMPVSWGTGTGMPEEAALDLAVTGLSLEAWKSLAADLSPMGSFDATLHVVSRQAGKQLAIDLSSKLTDFGARFGSNQISGANIEFSTKARVDEFKKVALENYLVQLSQKNATAIKVAGSGSLNAETKEMDVKTVLDAQIPQLLAIVKVPNMAASSGAIRFEGQIVQTKEGQTVVGNLALTDLSGKFTDYTLDRLQMKADLDLSIKGDNLQIRKMAGALQNAGLPGGSFDVSGSIDTKTTIGQLALNISGINQNLLKPFIGPALPGKQLDSIAVNSKVTALMEAGGKASFQGDLGITNLVVRTVGQTSAPSPLNAQFKFDASKQKDHVDIRQFQIALSPTARGQNQINIKGQADLAPTNAMKADVTVQADSIDITSFYDLYAGGKTNAAPAQPAAAQPAPATPANVEPEPQHWPVQQVLVSLNIGRFYLREIEITNWQASVKVEGSHVVVNPFQLSLNGAPINSTIDANLGVKGYTYQISLSMNKVPVEPLANSFVPEKRGAYKGDLLVNAGIKGAGITGINLRKSLDGKASFSLTNANIQLVGKWLPGLLEPIASALKLPELVSAPLDSIFGNLAMGQGKITVETFNLKSSAFSAGTQGEIPIADDLMNSPLDLPMNFALGSTLLKRVSVLSGLSNTNSPYVELPNFVKVSGTLKKPQTKPDYQRLLTSLAVNPQALSGVVNQIGGTGGQIIKGLGGILGGQTAPQTNSANANNTNTNAAPTGQKQLNQLLNLFNKPKK